MEKFILMSFDEIVKRKRLLRTIIKKYVKFKKSSVILGELTFFVKADET